jgi:hypothetical protein
LRSILHFPPERSKIASPGFCGELSEGVSSLTRDSPRTPYFHALYLLCGFSNEHQLQ